MQKNNEDIKLEEFLEKKWNEGVEDNPEFATFLGDHRFAK